MSGWTECSKTEYWEAINSRDSIVRAMPDYMIWQTRDGMPVAKSSVGYARPAAPEVFYVWSISTVADEGRVG